MTRKETWRGFIRRRVNELYDSGGRSAPDITNEIRGDLPLKYVNDCVRPAIYDEVRAVLRGRFNVNQQQIREEARKIRMANGEGGFGYFPVEEVPLSGIVEYVKAQLSLQDQIMSSTMRDLEAWKEAHPECDLSVAQIVETAEQLLP